jgi:hypothetical protein
MGGAVRDGRTVLYVSHNLGSVATLCDTCLLLEQGRIAYLGAPGEAIERYLNAAGQHEGATRDLTSVPERLAEARPVLTSIAIHGADGTPTTTFRTGGPLELRIRYRLDEPLPEAYAQVNLVDATGVRAVTLSSTHGSGALALAHQGEIRCRCSDLRLAGGEYTVEVELGSLRPARHWIDFVANALHFHVELGDFLGGSELLRGQGPLAQPSRWERMQ